jgi:hypothetical protein
MRKRKSGEPGAARVPGLRDRAQGMRARGEVSVRTIA